MSKSLSGTIDENNAVYDVQHVYPEQAPKQVVDLDQFMQSDTPHDDYMQYLRSQQQQQLDQPATQAAPPSQVVRQPPVMPTEEQLMQSATPHDDYMRALRTQQQYEQDMLVAQREREAAEAGEPWAVTKVTKAAATGLQEGIAQTAASLLGSIPKYVGTVTGIEPLVEGGEAVRKWFIETNQYFGLQDEASAPTGDLRVDLANPLWWVRSIATAVPSLAVSMVPGAMAGRAAQLAGYAPKAVGFIEALVGGTAGGSLEGMGTFEQALSEGTDPALAAIMGAKMGVASAGLNAISVGRMLRKVPDGVWKKVLETFVDGGVEGVTEYLEEPVDAWIRGDDDLKLTWENAVAVGGPAFFLGAATKGGIEYARFIEQNAAERKVKGAEPTADELAGVGVLPAASENSLHAALGISKDQLNAAEKDLALAKPLHEQAKVRLAALEALPNKTEAQEIDLANQRKLVEGFQGKIYQYESSVAAYKGQVAQVESQLATVQADPVRDAQQVEGVPTTPEQEPRRVADAPSPEKLLGALRQLPAFKGAFTASGNVKRTSSVWDRVAENYNVTKQQARLMVSAERGATDLDVLHLAYPDEMAQVDGIANEEVISNRRHVQQVLAQEQKIGLAQKAFGNAIQEGVADDALVAKSKVVVAEAKEQLRALAKAKPHLTHIVTRQDTLNKDTGVRTAARVAENGARQQAVAGKSREQVFKETADIGALEGNEDLVDGLLTDALAPQQAAAMLLERKGLATHEVDDQGLVLAAVPQDSKRTEATVAEINEVAGVYAALVANMEYGYASARNLPVNLERIGMAQLDAMDPGKFDQRFESSMMNGKAGELHAMFMAAREAGNLKYNADQITAVTRLTWARAEAWASLRTGVKPDDWYTTHFKSLGVEYSKNMGEPVEGSRQQAVPDYTPSTKPRGFRSALQEAVSATGLSQTKPTAAATWMAKLRKGQGVKQAEIHWSGIEEWLKLKGKATPAEVAEYLESRGKPFETTVTRETPPTTGVEVKEMGRGFYPGANAYLWGGSGSAADPAWQVTKDGEVVGYVAAYDAESAQESAENALYRRALQTQPQPRHPTYQLPGAKTEYTETIHAQPSETVDPDTEFVVGVHYPTPNIFSTSRTNVRQVGDQQVMHIEEIQSDLAQRRRDATPEELADLPATPYPQQAEYTALALKQVAMEAAAQGLDGITWTTGEQQADRYATSTRGTVLGIKWGSTSDGFTVSYEHTADARYYELDFDKAGKLTLVHQDESEYDLKEGTAIEKIFPAAVAAKIKASPSGTVAGEVVLGAAPMQHQYDRVTKNIAEKLLKAKATTVTLDLNQQVHFIPLTAAMRKEINENGYNLFNEAKQTGSEKVTVKGSVWMDQNEALHRALITLGPEADVSTVLHEVAHVFREDLGDTDYTAIIKWVRKQVGEDSVTGTFETGFTWSREADEKFVDAMEKYIFEGKDTPTVIQGPVAKLRDWLKTIYKSWIQRSADIKLNPEVRAAFARLFTPKIKLTGTGKMLATRIKTRSGQFQLNPYHMVLDDVNGIHALMYANKELESGRYVLTDKERFAQAKQILKDVPTMLATFDEILLRGGTPGAALATALDMHATTTLMNQGDLIRQAKDPADHARVLAEFKANGGLELLKKIAASKSEGGRAQRAHQINFAPHLMRSMLAQARRSMSRADYNSMLTRTAEAQEAVDANDPRAIKMVQDIMADLEHVPTLHDMWVQFMLSGMLWGPRTHLVNFVNNFAWYNWYGVVNKTFAAGADWALNFATGRDRTRYLSEVMPVLRSNAKYAQLQNWKDFYYRTKGTQVMPSGELATSPLDSGVDLSRKFEALEHAPDVIPINLPGTQGKVRLAELPIGKFFRRSARLVSGPTRSLRAADFFANSVAFSGHMGALAERAARQAMDKGQLTRKGKAMFVKQLLANPTEAMVMEAEQLARHTTFTDFAGSITRKILSGRENLSVLGYCAMPFVNTRMNIFKRGMERVPVLGVVAELMNRGNVDEEGNSEIHLANLSEFMAKQMEGAMIGLALVAVSGWFDDDDEGEGFPKIIGELSKAPGERARQQKAGIQEYSMRIGDKYVSFANLEPLAMPMMMTALLIDQVKAYKADVENPEKEAKVSELLEATSNEWAFLLAEQSVFNTALQLMDTSHSKWQLFNRSAVSAVVPFSSFMRVVATSAELMMNNNQVPRRDVSEALAPWLQVMPLGYELAERLGHEQPVKLDVFGEPLRFTAKDMYWNWSPIRVSAKQDLDAVDQEILKLEHGPGMPYPDNRLVLFEGKPSVKIPDDLYRDFLIAYGVKSKERLRQVIGSYGYQHLPYDTFKGVSRKLKMIDKAVTEVRTVYQNKLKAEMRKRVRTGELAMPVVQ